MNKIQQQIFDTQLAANSMVIYRNLLLNDRIVKKYLKMLEITSEEKPIPDAVSAYHDFLSSLIEENKICAEPLVGNLWQDHILNLILADENPFSLRCEKIGLHEIEQPLIELAERDLALLKILHDFDFAAFTSYIQEKSAQCTDFTAMLTMKGSNSFPYPKSYYEQKQKIKILLNNSPAWNKNISDLAKFYKNTGCGKFARYWAFKWADTENGGKLVGIPEPDPILLENLIGYEEQKNEVLRNTRQFVQGFGTNNMLLYGDRGTGKSSTIKALIHEFGEDGLRMVEVTKDRLIDLSNIVAELRDRPYRFIIFVDDLSFEEHETEYKYLKAILEGSLEPAPENVLIYATSNRRHLIREFHSDRAEDEAKAQDTLQEKLSLSDRFGITVVYLSPDQEKYLDIVEGIAESKGINIEPKQLREMALKWELWHNSRSGRTAKQFVEDLLGKMASNKEDDVIENKSNN